MHLNFSSKKISQTSSQESRVMVPSSASEVRVQSKLNPLAKEWQPSIDRGSKEERTLFITCSTAHPLRRSQILRFFSEKYGDCVETVVLQSREQRRIPSFGKVVFRTSMMPALILNGKNEVQFMINDRPLWCEKYQPRKTRQEDGVQ